jgi:hypothetical protein
LSSCSTILESVTTDNFDLLSPLMH